MAHARLPALLQFKRLLQLSLGRSGLVDSIEHRADLLAISCKVEGLSFHRTASLVNSICTSASFCRSTDAAPHSTTSSQPDWQDSEGSSRSQLRRASAQQASTSSRSSGNPQGSEASRKPRFPFDGKRKPPSSRPHSGGLAPEVAAKQDWPQQVARIGKVLGPYEVPRKPVFAVVELGPTQFKVSPGDIVVSEKIRDVDVNDKVKLARVMMLGSRHETIIGRPLIPQASITAVVEEQFQDAKVLIFKKRRRKSSRRLKGHRQDLTTLRIVEIHGIDEHSHSQDQSTSDHVAKELREEAA